MQPHPSPGIRPVITRQNLLSAIRHLVEEAQQIPLTATQTTTAGSLKARQMLTSYQIAIPDPPTRAALLEALLMLWTSLSQTSPSTVDDSKLIEEAQALLT